MRARTIFALCMAGLSLTTFNAQSSSALTITAGQAAIGMTATDFSNVTMTPSIDQFDPALGTLQQVILDLQGTVEGSMTFTNTNPNNSATISSTSSIEAELAASLVGGGGASLVTVIPEAQIGNPLTLAPAGQPGNTETANNLQNQSTNQAVYTDAATLALFTGTGLLDFEVSGLGFATTSTSGNVNTQSIIGAWAELTVTYVYQPLNVNVPEPATLALLSATSLAVLVGRRRTRN